MERINKAHTPLNARCGKPQSLAHVAMSSVLASRRRNVGPVHVARIRPAAGATDVHSIADALNTRGSTTGNGRQWTAATTNKLLISLRASELSRAIKIR